MFLHIAFKDGSNPYVKYGTDKELKREIKKWGKNYNLEVENITRNKAIADSEIIGYSVVAENKRDAKLKEMFAEIELDGNFAPLF